VQAEAILNMRLRSLRRLEEIEIRKEHENLTREGRELNALLASDALKRKKITGEIEATRKAFGDGPLGRRRTEIGGVPAPVDIANIVTIEREPVTVVLSEKGWIRALRGHVADAEGQKFKEGDALRLLLPAQTTDRLILMATNGRCYSLRAGDLPRGRGDGQAIRVMLDMAATDDIGHVFVLREDARYLLASSGGRGFIAPAADLVAERRAGKQVLNLRPGETAKICVPVEGDHVAVVGENRKLLVFPIEQIAELSRGLGVTLQKYKEGGLADAKTFNLKDGLTWRSGERTRTETNLRDWLGERGQAGKLPPSGFPRSGKFGG
jgi:topoisomerase-4 subunit A